ncbi:MAG: hypothetical protein IPI12_07525 [Ignavibacteriales bacterium]|nr:hypothetical protein [Ignavibacteriales bacterium]MBP7543378.1 hypothetical protein [Ignavibacteriaceae bacterium]MBK7266168.1 hypothetical protein [Ignavibacteriales bacterium]MBK8664073.1 hypothetical protein [Ignavibacteriales bacterium]MBP9122246.1 hypothetical protein [Ignavibacteriaceae bacterium]
MNGIEEIRNYFAPLISSGSSLPETDRLPDGSLFLLNKKGLSFLYLYLSGEKRLCLTIPAVVSKLPLDEGLPELTRVIKDEEGILEEFILIKNKWKKIE